MDDDNKYFFRLNDFSRNMQSSWRQAQHEDDFYDVILACEDKQIQAHKLILSSSSPILKGILKSYSNSRAIIYLMGMKYKDLANLVTFMYQGEVNIEQDELKRFMSAADDLQLEGIFGRDKESSNSNSVVINVKNKQQKIKNTFDFNKSNAKNEFIPRLQTEVMNEFSKNVSFKNTTKEVKYSTNNKTNDMSQNNMQGILSVSQDNMNEDSIQNKVYASQNIGQDIKSIGQDSIQPTVPVTEHGEVQYSCDLCSHKSKRIDSLRTHIAAVHQGVHIAPRKDALSKHSVLTHDEGVCYQCDKCDFIADKEALLKVHTATKHFKQEKVYHSCGYCDRKFNGKALLNNHIARIHEKVSYACDDCDRKFNAKGPLYTHIYAMHRNKV